MLYTVYRIIDPGSLEDIWQFCSSQNIDIIFTEYLGIRGLYFSVPNNIEQEIYKLFGNKTLSISFGKAVDIDLLNTAAKFNMKRIAIH